MKTVIEQIKEICNGIPYTRVIPFEAEKLAKENGVVVIVGGSDDLMYCYGADSFLTSYCEHSEGWDGCDLSLHASYGQLRREAKQLGLKIFWCGKIKRTGETIDGYDTKKSGAFSYKVADGIEYSDFLVMEDEGSDEVYCTGIIIKLPENFVSMKNNIC